MWTCDMFNSKKDITVNEMLDLINSSEGIVAKDWQYELMDSVSSKARTVFIMNDSRVIEDAHAYARCICALSVYAALQGRDSVVYRKYNFKSFTKDLCVLLGIEDGVLESSVKLPYSPPGSVKAFKFNGAGTIIECDVVGGTEDPDFPGSSDFVANRGIDTEVYSSNRVELLCSEDIIPLGWHVITDSSVVEEEEPELQPEKLGIIQRLSNWLHK